VAGKYLDECTSRVMCSRLEPLKTIARSIRNHRSLILNWFRARGQASAGAVDGLNNRVELVIENHTVLGRQESQNWLHCKISLGSPSRNAPIDSAGDTFGV
jgi:hypothetical protein